MSGMAAKGASLRPREDREGEIEPTEAGRRRLLRKAGLVKDTSGPSTDELVRRSKLETRPRGRILFQAGQVTEIVYVLARGRVRLARQSREGKEYLVSYREPMDLLGEAMLCGSAAQKESAETVEESVLLTIPLRSFRKAMESDASVAAKLLSAVSRRRAEAEEQIERLLFRNVESRIAELILSLVAPYGQPDPRGTLITMKVTHAEVSRTVGSTRETVTLTLGALRRRGLIDFDRRRIVVKDADRLRQLV